MRRLPGVLALLLVAVAAMASPAAGATDPVRIKTLQEGTIQSDPFFLEVRLKVACDPVGDLLETQFHVQNDEVSGEGFIRGVVCDGEWRTLTARAESFGNPFEPGRIFASSFILLIDPETNETFQGQDSRTIKIR